MKNEILRLKRFGGRDMDYEDRYDELYNIVSMLNVLVDEIRNEDYKEELRQIKWRAEDEMREVEELLDVEAREEFELELRERECEYRRMQGF